MFWSATRSSVRRPRSSLGQDGALRHDHLSRRLSPACAVPPATRVSSLREPPPAAEGITSRDDAPSGSARGPGDNVPGSRDKRGPLAIGACVGLLAAALPAAAAADT